MNRAYHRRRGAGRWIAVFLISCALSNGACSTVEPPTEAVSGAELGLRAAGEAGAAEYAPADLRGAKESLEKARRAMRSENYEEARRFAERALVEAELAEAKAETETTRRAVAELRRSIDALRAETERANRK